MGDEDIYANFQDFSSSNPVYFTNAEVNSVNSFDQSDIPLDINEFVKKNEIQTHNGGNFSTIQNAIDYVLTLGDFFDRNPSLISIETSVSSRIMAPSQDFFVRALRKFDSNRTILISFESLDDKSCYFAWRFKNRQQFMCLWIPSTDLDIKDFIKKFLFPALKHNHDASISSFTYDSEVVNIDLSYHSLGDSRDFNLLALSCLSGDIKAVNFLLNQGFDVNLSVKGQNPIDLAYNARNLDIVYELLKANSPFPENFEVYDASGDIKKFIEMTNLFHECVKRDDVSKVSEIIKKYPYLRHFYDLENNSAMTCMMAHEKFNIYETFVINHIYFGPKENIDGILSHISALRMKLLNRINQKHGREPIQKHIQVLMANSSVGSDTDDYLEKFNRIARTYKILNKNVLVSPILKAVAATRSFRINFDFSRESFRHLRPADEPYKNGTYQYSGRLQIAAKFLFDVTKENIVFGSLAHELCHLAMVAMYNNFGNPFDAEDFKTFESFQSIVEDCKSKKDMNEIISLIFQRYPNEMHPAELIAAVPHMVAHYYDSESAMTDFKIPYATLIFYYQEKVVNELKKHEGTLEPTNDLKQDYLVVVKDHKVLKGVGITLFLMLLLLGAFLGGLLFYYNSALFTPVEFNNSVAVGFHQTNRMKCQFALKGEGYRCAVYDVDWITESDSIIDGVIGLHETNKTNSNVQRFCIGSNKVVAFPQKLGQHFPELTSIFLQELGMKVIPKQSFKGLTKLLHIDVARNKIKYIEAELFVGTALDRIDLSENQITKVFPNAFKDLKIFTLSFRDNKCYSNDKLGNVEECAAMVMEIMEKCSCDEYNSDICYEVDSKQKSLVVVSMISVSAVMFLFLLIICVILCVFCREKRKVALKKVDDDCLELNSI